MTNRSERKTLARFAHPTGSLLDAVKHQRPQNTPKTCVNPDDSRLRRLAFQVRNVGNPPGDDSERVNVPFDRNAKHRRTLK